MSGHRNRASMMINLQWAITLLLQGCGLAAASDQASNLTNAVETTGWRSEPPSRGTFRLLFSCMVTSFLCVYTALHLNIPQQGTSKTAIYREKFAWVLLGIFAPELVVYTAWGQWNSAKKLTAKMNELLDLQKPRHNLKAGRKHSWTIVHSFYAGMGGFVIDTDDSATHPYIPGSPRLSVTAQGMSILAEHGHIPDISVEFINDKSKADNVAKTLAIVQAGWLLIQCLTRVAVHLPLTLLEINTLAHVLCTLVMFCLWMKKPYDIHEPLLLSGDWVRPLSATMWMFSRISTQTKNEGDKTFHEWPEIERVIYVDKQNLAKLIAKNTHSSGMEDPATSISLNEENDVERRGEGSPNLPFPGSGEIAIEMDGIQPLLSEEPDLDSRAAGLRSDIQIVDLRTAEIARNKSQSASARYRDYVKLGRDQVVNNIGFGPKPDSHHFRERDVSTRDVFNGEVPIGDVSTEKSPKYYKPPVELELNPITLTRWQLALSVLQDYHTIWDRYRTSYNHKPATLNSSQQVAGNIEIWEYPDHLVNENLVDPEIQNRPGKDLLGQANTLVPVIILCLATASYGGIHAAATNEYFPSPIEHKLWTFAARFIAASGFTWSVASFIYAKFDITMPKHWLVKTILFIPYVVVKMAVVLSLNVYAFARAFLVFEAFYSLRRLPVDAYKTPVFTDYLPHL